MELLMSLVNLHMAEKTRAKTSSYMAERACRTFGHLMIGTVPRVTRALNRPSTMLSTAPCIKANAIKLDQMSRL